jgi:Spy/CpxP family protein refolding chaperone
MQQHRGPSVELQLKQLTELLMLTPDQQKQVGALLTDEQQQIEALLKPPADGGKPASSEDQPPSREAMEAARAAIKAIHEDTQSKIAAVLTDDQKTKFEVWEKQRAEASRQQDGEMPPPPPDGDGGPPPDGGGPGGGGPSGM